ncbi:MAG: hypothetical protein GX643_02065 [Acidimicrobiales bacterium]|nr:hypothetical protein [Acidimicrobiales bacterium]
MGRSTDVREDNVQKWGFIYTLGDEDGAVRRDVIGSPACELICVGIPSVDGAAEAARGLMESGVQLIELCGAFEAEGLAAVKNEVEGKIPVGAVFYGGDAASGLHRLFS